MSIDTTIRRWTPPSDGNLARAHIAKISQALNQLEGLHSAVIPNDVQLASQDRLLLLGPQSTPTGVVVSLAPGSVMVTM